MAKDEGTAEMRAVSTPIREGAEGFLRVQVRFSIDRRSGSGRREWALNTHTVPDCFSIFQQYSAIARLGVVLAVLIAASYSLRPAGGAAAQHGVGRLGNLVLGVVAALSFVFGAVCSAGAGYLSMWVAAHTNIRVASAAR